MNKHLLNDRERMTQHRQDVSKGRVGLQRVPSRGGCAGH